MDLVTLPELRVWTRESIDAEEDVAFANYIIEAVNHRVHALIDHEGWTEEAGQATISNVRTIAAKVATRSYLNPTQEVRTAAIGPIGGVAYHDDFTRFLEFTDRELEQLSDIAAEFSGSSGLSVQRIVRDDVLLGYGYGNDIVLNDSDHPQSAGILYAHEDDAMWFTEQNP